MSVSCGVKLPHPHPHVDETLSTEPQFWLRDFSSCLPEVEPAAAMDGGGATVTSGVGNEETEMGHQVT